MRLSQRAQRLAESATTRMTRRAAELQDAGREIISFGVGEPDFPSPAVAVEAARQALADGFTRYTPTPGTLSLRAAVAAHYRARYGTPWRGAETVITVGGKSALFELIMTLIEPGDRVVLPSPAWVSFAEQVRFAGGEPVTVATSWRDRFAIHADAVLEALDARTRAVLLNAPCNPTGGVMAAGDLARVVAACAARGVTVISDETYERFVYDGAAHASAAALAAEHPDTVVVVGSFSKTYAMTGWRVGYALGPRPLIDKVAALQSHITSNPTSFAMVGAEAALAGAEDDVAAMIAEFEARRDLVAARLEAMPGVRCASPAGAFYVFPNVSQLYRPGRQGSVALAEHLLDAAGVAVVPGIAFGADDHIRISFATGRQALETGLTRMAEALGG